MEPSNDPAAPDRPIGTPSDNPNEIQGQPRVIPAGRYWLWAVVGAIVLAMLYMLIS